MKAGYIVHCLADTVSVNIREFLPLLDLSCLSILHPFPENLKSNSSKHNLIVSAELPIFNCIILHRENPILAQIKIQKAMEYFMNSNHQLREN